MVSLPCAGIVMGGVFVGIVLLLATLLIWKLGMVTSRKHNRGEPKGPSWMLT